MATLSVRAKRAERRGALRPRSTSAHLRSATGLQRRPVQGPLAIVLGSDEIASAIAHALRSHECAVVLTDEIDPPGALRGMSFVNAWYLGSAELDGIAACFCSSVKSIPEVIDRQQLVAATAWSWQGIAAVLHPEVLVDARSAHGGTAEALRDRVPGLVCLACGFGVEAPGHVDAAIETAYGDRAGAVVLSGRTSPDPGLAPPLAGLGEERCVYSPRNGRFRTQLRIGDRVDARDPLGDVNGTPLEAPVSGVLRGISARGARVRPGCLIAEIDPRGQPSLCYGIDPHAAAIARGVVRALQSLGLLPERPPHSGDDLSWTGPSIVTNS